MPEQKMRNVVFRAALGDCCSGLVRVVDDVQRFGLQLQTLILGAAVATFLLSIPCGAIAGFIATRLARHPGVASVEVQSDCSTSQSLQHAPLLQTQVDGRPVAEPDRSIVSHAS